MLNMFFKVPIHISVDKVWAEDLGYIISFLVLVYNIFSNKSTLTFILIYCTFFSTQMQR